MKLLSLSLLALALTAGTASAAPALGFMVAEQVADAPSQQDQYTGNKAANPNESPSKKLSQSKGVIHPPPTHDRAVVKPPGNTTGEAVISPPGTPGGDPSVQPK